MIYMVYVFLLAEDNDLNAEIAIALLEEKGMIVNQNH